MKATKPKIAGLPRWLDTPEPDVTWGKGGIDNWGWQALAVVPTPTPPTTAPNPSIPPKETIPHA